MGCENEEEVEGPLLFRLTKEKGVKEMKFLC